MCKQHCLYNITLDIFIIKKARATKLQQKTSTESNVQVVEK